MHKFFRGSDPIAQCLCRIRPFYVSTVLSGEMPIEFAYELNADYLFKSLAFNDIILMIWEIGCGKIDQN